MTNQKQLKSGQQIMKMNLKRQNRKQRTANISYSANAVSHMLDGLWWVSFRSVPIAIENRPSI